MVKRREDKNIDGFESMSVIRRKAIQMELTDIQRDLCAYFNDCFLKSVTNPITMAKQLTKKFDIKQKKKKKNGK